MQHKVLGERKVFITSLALYLFVMVSNPASAKQTHGAPMIVPNDTCVLYKPCSSGNYFTLRSYLHLERKDIERIFKAFPPESFSFYQNTESFTDANLEVEVFTTTETVGKSEGFYFFDEGKVAGFLLLHRKSLSYDLDYLKDIPSAYAEQQSAVRIFFSGLNAYKSKSYTLDRSHITLTVHTLKMGDNIHTIGLIKTNEAVYILFESYLPVRLKQKYLKIALQKADRFIVDGNWMFY